MRGEDPVGGVDAGDHGGFLPRGGQVIASDLDWFISRVAVEESLQSRVIPNFAPVRPVCPSSQATGSEVATKFREEALDKVADDSDQTVVTP